MGRSVRGDASGWQTSDWSASRFISLCVGYASFVSERYCCGTQSAITPRSKTVPSCMASALFAAQRTYVVLSVT